MTLLKPRVGSEPQRFPNAVYGHGAEPDARFSLANERTFLAWIRTSLALLAGGVALVTAGSGIHPAFRLLAATFLLVTGTGTAARAWFSWARTEKALRERRPLPAPNTALPIGLAVVVIGLLVIVGAWASWTWR